MGVATVMAVRHGGGMVRGKAQNGPDLASQYTLRDVCGCLDGLVLTVAYVNELTTREFGSLSSTKAS
jgi:hypothetical protein